MTRGGHGEVDNTFRAFVVFIALLAVDSSFVLQFLTAFADFYRILVYSAHM
jgi:hypothetical protein